MECMTQCLAPFDHVMMAALALHADEFDQESHHALGCTVARWLRFRQPTCQSGLFRQDSCRKPYEVSHSAIAFEARVELPAQVVPRRVGEPRRQLAKTARQQPRQFGQKRPDRFEPARR
jgi:hypothetical protein